MKLINVNIKGIMIEIMPSSEQISNKVFSEVMSMAFTIIYFEHAEGGHEFDISL